MYTETLPGESLALMITSLSVEMGGKYYCTASYANTEILEKGVTIKTYGKSRLLCIITFQWRGHNLFQGVLSYLFPLSWHTYMYVEIHTLNYGEPQTH